MPWHLDSVEIFKWVVCNFIFKFNIYNTSEITYATNYIYDKNFGCQPKHMWGDMYKQTVNIYKFKYTHTHTHTHNSRGNIKM